jgi:prepilin-type N-terminal cleavage/methylation domain-containing protein
MSFYFKTDKKGFTLVELLVVMAIIAVMSSVVLAALSNARERSRDAKRIADFRQIKNALELFYDQTGQYPQSPGHATWSGHWAYFSECLEEGTNCGFTVSNYEPVISKVPQDPSRTTNDPFADGATYYPGYPTGCSDGQGYRIAAYLEGSNEALENDYDGSFYNNNGGCADANNYYCLGAGTCAGW